MTTTRHPELSWPTGSALAPENRVHGLNPVARRACETAHLGSTRSTIDRRLWGGALPSGGSYLATAPSTPATTNRSCHTTPSLWHSSPPHERERTHAVRAQQDPRALTCCRRRLRTATIASSRERPLAAPATTTSRDPEGRISRS